MTKKWYAIYKDGLDKILSSGLTAAEYDVLLFLFSQMDEKTNCIYIKQSHIIKSLVNIGNDSKEKDKGTVSRSIKNLNEQRLIRVIPYGFMINPEIYYYGGNFRNMEELIELFNSEEKDWDDILDRHFNMRNRLSY